MKIEMANYFCTKCGNTFVLAGVRTNNTKRECPHCKSGKIYMKHG
ncbi:unnamed protein product [marine sediment metagenome]|uniref:Uncharacterized protein n=1 Tax=marine sediment metagenome TaxID=412755 RepID=X0TFK2_9ZZZZ